MNLNRHANISIKGANTNNLKNVSLKVPHNKFIVVTGISGSGKSSLVFDIIAKEGQRRYFETLPSFARQFVGKLNRPDVDEIEGLSPVIAIGQQTSGMHARSTVGTMSDLYGLLRLLFARTGTTDREIQLSRALFSFNSVAGKCQQCNGIGNEEKIDLNKLVVHPEKTLREGALAPTLPTGYIMYSQVTIDVLNQVCEAEGFNVDIPWDELTNEQQKVILYGSEKIKVPFGKHSLESRLKWTGIKAKPREEGYYRGMMPIMSDILRRDRNANILKYVSSVVCQSCDGTRLNQDALSVYVNGATIAEVSSFELHELKNWINANKWNKVGLKIKEKISAKINVLVDLGLGHLTLNRPSNTLRSSEIQRLRVANQILMPLSDVLYIFDEPSIGLDLDEKHRMIYQLRKLVQKGNTVIVVEHDLETIRNADHIIEIGPKAGVHGGELIYNGELSNFIKDQTLKSISPTYEALVNPVSKIEKSSTVSNGDALKLIGCRTRNLKNIDVEFRLGEFNVVSGPSGSGKSSLVKEILLKSVTQFLDGQNYDSSAITSIENLNKIDKLIFIDHSPIGKTPRSNAATYLNISDHIRDLFAKQSDAKSFGYSKSRFSFNNKGGRCETCQGAGKTQIGMHFLGDVDLICGDCNGDRFNQDTLRVRYQGRSIADIYKLSINEAIVFFEGQNKILSGLEILQEIGLGYLTLGQSSTTLSGGEAQRIKIANQLQKKDTGDTLYIIVEPTIGLHYSNIQSLLAMFERIKQNGNTIVCIEQHESIIEACDWHIELGPTGGQQGGTIVFQGVPNRERIVPPLLQAKTINSFTKNIVLNGVETHGLKNIDVRIPKNQLTVVTGLSGSGKSSLVYDTLFSEANTRFLESLSVYSRSFVNQTNVAQIQSFSGLGPAIGINRKGGGASKRSTVGTLSGAYESFRLLYSRIAQSTGVEFSAQHFSFNHHLGACSQCEGVGNILTCDPDEIIIDHSKTILDGAISNNKAIGYYSNPDGQFVAILKEVARKNQFDLNEPWSKLSEHVQNIILHGTGDQVWDTEWEFKTKSRSGVQAVSAKWLGFCGYIDDEYERKKLNKNIKSLEELLNPVICNACGGGRLKQELLDIRFQGKNIHQFTSLNISELLVLLGEDFVHSDSVEKAIVKKVIPAVETTLNTMKALGLGYLTLDRSIATLSGGERQRVMLAGQLSTHLFGVTYVLDEPTIGLDSVQIKVLTKALKKVVANGNTVVVVEHDPTFIQEADYLIELGPGAGREGGEVIYQGVTEGVFNEKQSLTYQMLQESSKQILIDTQEGLAFGISGASANNLQKINVEFQSQQLIAITGVSGSGKSSLVKDVLYKSYLKSRPIECDEIYGLDQFDNVLLIDQELLLQNRLSTPVTYLGMLEKIQMLFSKTEDAKNQNLKKADFSYQSKNGKCSNCAGHGKVKTSMDFMSDVWLDCDICNGTRYNENVQQVKWKALNIGQVLDLTVGEAIRFFETEPLIEQLQILVDLGLGHLILGQAGNTLSGGEAQRLKLANSLIQKRKGITLYLFDEPSTGLHYFDVIKLIKVFRSIVEKGDTLIFIEHNQTMIEAAQKVYRLESGKLK